jgi:ribonuclease HI
MKAATPHYLLFSESRRDHERDGWRFVLRPVDGCEQLEAADAEPDVHGERLELLAVVRGLEALEQPSRVTLLTPSEYVNRGLAYGLDEWRANDWQWEHFGEMVPVKNRDLWQRIDRALMFHQVEWRRFDPPHEAASEEANGAARKQARLRARARTSGGQAVVAACKLRCEGWLRRIGSRLAGSCARRRAIVQFE